MGGVLSLQPTCEQPVINASQCLCAEYSYIYNISENLASLKKAIENLKAKKGDVESRLKIEEVKGRQRTLEVQRWLKEASSLEVEYNGLHSSNIVELQRLCLCGFCSKNLKQSYFYGKKVAKLLKEVKDPDFKINMNALTEPAPIPEARVLRLPDIIVGHETLFEKVWGELTKNEVGILGLCGMGGVGKTTLLKQINNRFAKPGGKFKVVIWVDAENATIHKIQEYIAKKLEYGGEVLDWETARDRATALYDILKKKKFVLLFDGIWKPVDLEEVGIPNPNTENGCKIVFTTRLKEVCGGMRVDPMEIQKLDFDNAWDLFQKIVSAKTLDSRTGIRELAMKVTRICDGLPLALHAIGKTMACKDTIGEWRHAIRNLTSHATTELSETKKQIFPILKYSYDNLSNNRLKSCFLYCSLFPRDYLIDKEKLIDYWICEKLIDENEGRGEALDQGHHILRTLIRASLLEEISKDHWAVSMHDMFRGMALSITTDFVENEDHFFVQKDDMLCEVPREENWRIATRVSLMKSEIKEIVDGPHCPRLTTLLLQDNCNLWNISGDFFRYMPELLVLDLSNNQDLHELPEEILRLAFLRYLDLSYTKIKRLPLDVQELKSLIHLNLEHTRMLKSLNRVSKFSSLRIFRLLDSNVMLDMKLMEELEMLRDLEFVSINISPSMTQEQWFHDSKVGKCIQEVCIKELPSESVERLVFPAAMSKLHGVYIESCKMLEITTEKTMGNRSLPNPYFSNLTYVSIVDCNGLKDLTWLMFASKLTHLSVSYSSELEAIISEEKATSVSEEERCNDSPFGDLEYLYLYSLPKLKSIYWTFLPFPCLKQMSINSCDDLTKLPLDSTSVFKVEEFVGKYDDEEWIKNVEWKDDDTKRRFSPYFQHYQDQNPGKRFRRRQRVV